MEKGKGVVSSSQHPEAAPPDPLLSSDHWGGKHLAFALLDGEAIREGLCKRQTLKSDGPRKGGNSLLETTADAGQAVNP